jgi:hypothetical protein
MKKIIVVKGGAGSGHHGHSGRPGKVGGSQSGDGGPPIPSSADPRNHESVSDKKKRDYEQHMAKYDSSEDYVQRHNLKYNDVLQPGYLDDLENNLKLDAYEWEKYRDNPAPYVGDMLLDFGKWPDSFEALEFEVKVEVAQQIALDVVSPRSKEMEEKKEYFGQEVLKGGPGSGNHGHTGKAGMWGGSDKGGGGQGGPTKKKPKAKPKAKPKSDPYQDYLARNPGAAKPQKGHYVITAGKKVYVPADEGYEGNEEESPGPVGGVHATDEPNIKSEQDMIDAGGKRIGSGHINYYDAADQGVGTLSKGDEIEIGSDIDTYYQGNKVTGIITDIEDDFYTVDIRQEGYPGHGDSVKFQFYPEASEGGVSFINPNTTSLGGGSGAVSADDFVAGLKKSPTGFGTHRVDMSTKTIMEFGGGVEGIRSALGDREITEANVTEVVFGWRDDLSEAAMRISGVDELIEPEASKFFDKINWYTNELSGANARYDAKNPRKEFIEEKFGDKIINSSKKD